MMSENSISARLCACRPVHLVTFSCSHTCCNYCGKSLHFNPDVHLPRSVGDHLWNKDKCPDCSMAYNLAMLTKTLEQSSLDHQQPLQLQLMGSTASSPSLDSPDFSSPGPQQYRTCSPWPQDPSADDRMVKRQLKPSQQQQQDIFQQQLPHYHHQLQQPRPQSGHSNNGLPHSHAYTPSSSGSSVPHLPHQLPPPLFGELQTAEGVGKSKTVYSGSQENVSKFAKPPVGRALRCQQQTPADGVSNGQNVSTVQPNAQNMVALASPSLPQVPAASGQQHLPDNPYKPAVPFLNPLMHAATGTVNSTSGSMHKGVNNYHSTGVFTQGFHSNGDASNSHAAITPTSSSTFIEHGGARPKAINATGVGSDNGLPNGHAFGSGCINGTSSQVHAEIERRATTRQSPALGISADLHKIPGNSFSNKENCGSVPFTQSYRNGTTPFIPNKYGSSPSVPQSSLAGSSFGLSHSQIEMQSLTQNQPPRPQICLVHCQPAHVFCRLCEIYICFSCCSQGAEHEFHDLLYIEREVMKQQQHMQQIFPSYEDLVFRLAELQAAISAVEKAGETDLFRIHNHLQACMSSKEKQKENLFACLSRILGLLKQLPLARMRELVEMRVSDTFTPGGLARKSLPTRDFRWPVDQYDDTTLLPKDAQLMKGWGAAVSSARQRLYVTDRDSHTVWVFRFEAKENGLLVPVPDFCFGKFGRCAGQFIRPTGVDVHDGLGRVAVVDKDNHRVQVFNLDGKFLFQFGRPRAEMEKGRGEVLEYPWDVAFRQDGYMAITNSKLNRVIVFTADGIFYRMYPPENWYPHLFENPRGICFDQEGKLFVTDFQKSQLIVIGRDFKTHKIYTCHVEEDVPNRVATPSFNFPQGITVDDAGSIYVCDGKNLRVLRFSRDSFTPNGSNFGCLIPDAVYQTPGFNPDERLFSVCLSPTGCLITVHSIKRKEWLTQDMATRINRRIQKSRELSHQKAAGSCSAVSVREGLHDVEKTRMLIFRP